MRDKARRGFSLLEGLFSIMLTFLVLGALAKTLSDTGKIRANRSEMDRAVEEYHGLNLIRTDIVANLQVIKPETGDTGSVLRIRRVNPELSFAQRIDSSGDPANAYERSEKVEVSYRVRDDALLRGVGPVDGTLVEERVQRCHAMEVTRWPKAVVLKLTFEYSRIARIRTMKIELR